MKKIEIEIPDGKKAEWVNGVLTLVDERPANVMERIKTFQDAVLELGNNHPYVKEYDAYYTKCAVDTIAYLQLKIICAALNEDKDFPRFTEDESRYSPYFELYTKEEIDGLGNEAKKQLRLWGGYVGKDSYCGLICSGSTSAFSQSSAHFEACLVLKSKELAEYCGKKFINIWKHLLIGKY